MAARIARWFVVGVATVALTGVSSAFGGWNPFASEKSGNNTKSQTTAASARNAQTSPSLFDKIGAGTKNAWYTVTGKKPEPQKRRSLGVAYPKNPLATPPKDSSASWLPWGKTEEKKPTSVKDWMKTHDRPKME